MEAQSLMTQEPTWIDEETPIDIAWKMMKRLRVRHLPVVDCGKLVGIVSDRQLLTRATRRLNGELAFPDLCAAEVMTFKPRSCDAKTPVQIVAAEMLDRDIDAVPVVADDGRLLGLVTWADLVRVIAQS